ncbi:MAG: M6 family metalloprotease domain-containing protein [Desulfobacteraceae bacterium]|nr:M6 family metalloprotease domain-containing protein [Desulfobacteraceae bacterium]
MSIIQSEKIVLEQANGTPVALVVTGDEFYARHETMDGFTVVYDETKGLYCYAQLISGRFRSSGIPTHKRPPVGTRRHLQESPEVRSAKFENRFRTLYPGEGIVPGAGGVNFTLGPNNGLLAGRRVSDGNVLGMTILVEFQDLRIDMRIDDVKAMLNDDNFIANGNHCSVRTYFREVSNGKLDYRNRVVGPVRLSHDRRYYETHPLQREALQAAITGFNLNLAEFDSRNEGVVDAVSFLYAGRTVYGINGDTSRPSDLWPHNSEMSFQHNGIRTNYYMLTSLGRSSLDLSIGTFCHESGHLLCRFPDLYDYGRRDDDFTESAGLASYCLMSSGNHNNYGRTPAPICSYLRDLVGWPDLVVSLNEAGKRGIAHGDYAKVYKYVTDTPNEYFLLENRSRLGLDAHLPASGLAVFHCDTEGSNEWQQGSTDRHYQCALLQADGRRDLENDRRGDATDLFAGIPGIALSNTTLPSSREWDGSDSGFILREISVPGAEMFFGVGLAPTHPAEGAVTGESAPDLLIPDNAPEGMRDTIPMTGEGTITSLTVGVDIIHTYQGDLSLDLYSPRGTRIVLYAQHNQPGHDLVKTFVSTDHEELYRLHGESFAGNWLLHIKDLEAYNMGRLNAWEIEIHYQSAEQSIEKESTPELKIPDNNPVGLDDRIQIDARGRVRNIEVLLDVTHTFIRDLRVELVAPSGHSVFLHDREGGGSRNIHRTYDQVNHPRLETLMDLPVQGAWTLNIKDLEGWDTGILNHWSLKLTYERD